MIVTASQVAQFHRAFGHPVNEHPSDVSIVELRLRIKLIIEELIELMDALNTEQPMMWENCRHHLRKAYSACDSLEPARIDPVEATDALADLTYVVTGMALVLGLPIVPAVDEVHRSNMSKLGQDGQPILASDGKIKKGPNYSPPNLKQFFRGENERSNRFLSAWDVVERTARHVDDLRHTKEAS